MNSFELKELREKFNLSQEDVANITSVSVRTVKSWEYGERNISKSAEKLLNVHCNGYEENTQSGKIKNISFENLSIEEKLNKIFEQNLKIIEGLSQQKIENQDHKNIIVEYVDLSLQPIIEFIGATKKQKENK